MFHLIQILLVISELLKNKCGYPVAYTSEVMFDIVGVDTVNSVAEGFFPYAVLYPFHIIFRNGRVEPRDTLYHRILIKAVKRSMTVTGTYPCVISFCKDIS